MNETVIDQYEAQITKLYEDYRSEVEADQDLILYHYTSYEGLKGILSSKRFWFTDYHFLNDPTEIKYALDLFNSTIDSKEKKLTLFRLLFNDGLSKYRIGTLSFLAEEKDYLPAWRWYASDGSGFTIGVRLQELVKIFSVQNQNDTANWISTHYKISYEHQAFKKYIKSILGIFITYLNQSNRSEDFIKFGSCTASCIYPFLPQCKHMAYQEEKEYRFIMMEKNPTEKRIINSSPSVNERGYFLRANKKEGSQFVNPIPTIISESFDICESFEKSVVASIGIGPTCNKMQTRYEVEKLLKQNGFDTTQTTIYDSEIPYRG